MLYSSEEPQKLNIQEAKSTQASEYHSEPDPSPVKRGIGPNIIDLRSKAFSKKS